MYDEVLNTCPERMKEPSRPRRLIHPGLPLRRTQLSQIRVDRL